MYALGVMKIGLLTLLAKLAIIPESVADEAALEFLRRYGPLEDATWVERDEDKFKHYGPFDSIPDPEDPSINVSHGILEVEP